MLTTLSLFGRTKHDITATLSAIENASADIILAGNEGKIMYML